MSEHPTSVEAFGRKRAERSSSFASRVMSFIRLGRPLFLVGGVVSHGIGAAAASLAGARIDGKTLVAGQVVVTAFQLMTHYANDHFDFEADCANGTPTKWSGGSRVLTDGKLPRVVALVAAIVFGAIGAGAALGMASAGRASGTALLLALAIGALSWAYSAPPVVLHSRGLGEATAALVVTALVPAWGFELQRGGAAGGWGTLWLATLPLVLLQFAMVLAVAFPDAEADACVGKRTLVVRLGADRAARLYAAVTAAAFLMLLVLVFFGLPFLVGGLAAAPLGVWRARRALAGDPADPQRFEAVTFWAVALLVATSMATLIGLIAA